MMNPIDAVLEIAKAEIGYLEKRSNSMLDSKNANAGRNNYTKYARDLYKLGVYNGNKQGHAWCDQWCDWCFIQAFGVEQAWKITGQTMGGCGAGCEFSAKAYKQMGCWHNIPERGDQIFFQRHGTICHTGLVERVENNMVYTIEGNTSSAHAVVPNGGGVFRKCYPIEHPQIAGFGRPRYELVKEVKSPVSYEQFKEYLNKWLKEQKALPPSDWSEDDRVWAEGSGLICGDANGQKMYKSFATREQMIIFLHRLWEMLQ